MLEDLQPDEARDFRIKLLTLRAGIEFERLWVSWCDEAAAEVTRMSDALKAQDEEEKQ